MMTDRELCALVDNLERDGVSNSGDFDAFNEKLFKYYNSEKFGDEIDGQSQVVTSDVADIVEADMPSLTRIFLSGNDIVEFRPTTSRDISEAEEKNVYIPWVLRNVKDSFRKQFGWIKQTEIQSVGILEYGIRDERNTRTFKLADPTEEELIKTVNDADSDPKVSSVEIIAQEVDEDNGSIEVEIRVTEGEQEYFIENVATEDLILSRNAQSKDDADIVGKWFRKSRGDLIAEGFSEDLVKSLPANSKDDQSSAKQERYKRQGGEDEGDSGHWTNELIEGMDVYVKADYDEDGIPERRHIIKVGSEILENEPFDHVPFSICSAVLMPMNIIGKSRAEQGVTTQRVQSVLTRNVLDNIYSVNNPGSIINDDIIEMDDMLTQRPNRIVRSSGNIAGAYLPIETPYIGDKALQVVQYMDSLQSRRTGSQLSSQGLDADTLHKETATRFEGVQDAGAAKTELVARVIAEVGYRDLIEGLAWYAKEYQDSPKEILINNEPRVIDPSKWTTNHRVESVVGTGAGDNEKTLETLSGIYALQLQQKQEGSTLTDDKKIYNTLSKIVKASGLNRTDMYWNDPEVPAQTLFAQNQLLKQQLQLMQQQLEDPLSKAEKIKQQGSAIRDKMKYQHELQMKGLDISQEEKDRMTEVFLKTVELELDHNTDIPGFGLDE